MTPSGEYTFGIEGPAVDLDGNLFVVNFGKPGTIGKLPAGGAVSELFTALPEGSVGNAIRFDRNGTHVRRRLQEAQHLRDPERRAPSPSSGFIPTRSTSPTT